MKYLLAALLMFAASSAVADDGDPPPPVVTRFWQVKVSVTEQASTHSATAYATDDREETVAASYGFIVGTTDDDMAGGTSYAISQDVTKQMRGLGGSGTYHAKSTHKPAKGIAVSDITEAALDTNNSSTQCFYSKEHWECSVNVNFVGTEHWEPADVAPPPQKGAGGMSAHFGGGTGHANEPNAHASKTKDDRFAFTDDYTSKGTGASLHQQVSITIEPLGPPKKYVAVFVPDAGYDKWLPEGPPVPPSTHQPATIGTHLELLDSATYHTVAKSFRAHYILETSTLVGECMNWPDRGARPPTDQPDLYFDAAKNKSGTITKDGRELDLGDGKGGAAITVSSRDWGGYAKLRAHVVVADGTELDAQVDAKADTFALAIPKDDNGNHIGDAWETQGGKPLPSGNAADSDDENTPSGWAAKGDGYTLFEEYRGFVEADPSSKGTVIAARKPKLRHARFDPTKRDVFIGVGVSDDVADLAVAGIADWAGVSKITVHYIAASNLLAPTPGDYPGNEFPRRADLWGDGHDDLFAKPQMALWVQSKLNLGTSPAHCDPIAHFTQEEADKFPTPADSHAFGSFGNVHGVTLDLASSAETVKGLICDTNPACALDPKKQPKTYAAWKVASDYIGKTVGIAKQKQRYAWGDSHKPLLNARFTQFVFMHELGHAIGMYHHGLTGDDEPKGEPTCPMRYWHRGENYDEQSAFVGGEWDLSKSYSGVPWQWCRENWPTIRVADKP